MDVFVGDVEKMVTRAVTHGVAAAVGMVAFGVLVLSLLVKAAITTPKDGTDHVTGPFLRPAYGNVPNFPHSYARSSCYR